MKLIDVLDLIPKTDTFSVELYDDNGEMIYAYIIGPKDDDRSVLMREHTREVIGLHAGTLSSVHFYKDIPILSIEIRV